MAYEKDIKQKLIEIARNGGQWLFTAEVMAVNGNTCTVRAGNTILADVWLTAYGQADNCLLITPAIGSLVLVADLSGGDKRELHVLQYGAIERVAIGGTQNGGIPIPGKLVEWMNKVASDMQTLSSLLSTTPVAGNGAPLGALFQPQTSTITVNDIENQNVKHG